MDDSRSLVLFCERMDLQFSGSGTLQGRGCWREDRELSLGSGGSIKDSSDKSR